MRTSIDKKNQQSKSAINLVATSSSSTNTTSILPKFVSIMTLPVHKIMCEDLYR
jgi:hypothetical protein